MKQTRIYRLCTLATLLAITSLVNAQLLKGTIKADNIRETQLAYTLDGDVMSMEYAPIQMDATGNYSFDIEMPVQRCDVSIYVNDTIFGAHIEKGKTAIVNISRNPQTGKLEASYEGDNAALSHFQAAFSNAFNVMKYFSLDPATRKTNAEYSALLEREYAALKELLPTIEDKELRNFYATLSKGTYQWQRLRQYMDQAEEEKKDIKEYPEYNEIIAAINPNDPMNVRTNLNIAWLSYQQKEQITFGGDMAPFCLEAMAIVEKEIVTPAVRLALAKYIAYSYFTYGSTGDILGFWNQFKEFAKEYPQLIASYEGQVAAKLKTAKGQDVPYNPVMTRPDNTTCKLSDFYGKLIYIDVWATWCGPCCKEIPYLEKVVERFKGNDKVLFLSISTDTNQKAWLKKLDADKPAWPQFILSREEQKKFMSAWGISGIPRFILIGKDGKILSADALRPSDEGLIQTLEANM